MGRFEYTESEKETLKVLKMQEQQLERLQTSLNSQNSDLEEIHAQAETLLKQHNVSDTHIQTATTTEPSKLQVSKSDIPSWEECVEQANKEVQAEVEIEDLLSQERFNFCIDEVKRINTEFSTKTSILNKKDLAFLTLATALQTARWLIIQKLMGDLGQTIDTSSRLKHDDKSIRDNVRRSNIRFQQQFQRHGHQESLKSYKSWEQIIFSSAPYDTSVRSSYFGENLEGKFHRYKTLGHDPILGWIFGTANFITDTCTLSNYNSYRISRVGRPHFSEAVSLPKLYSMRSLIALEKIGYDYLQGSLPNLFI